MRKKQKNYVVSYHAVASQIRIRAAQKDLSIRALARACGVTPGTVSLWLVGSSDMRISRLYTLAEQLGLTEGDLLNEARGLCARLANELEEPVTILARYPEVPAPNMRIIRAHELNDYFDRKLSWQELMGPGVFRADDLWRRRVELGLSRVDLASKIGVASETIRRWETLKFDNEFWGDSVSKALNLGVKEILLPIPTADSKA